MSKRNCVLRLLYAFCFLPLLLLCSLPFTADEVESEKNLAQALKSGDYWVGLRYRYVEIADDNPTFMGNNGRASTLRTTLGYKSGAFYGLGINLEFENVVDIGLADQHNNLGYGDLNNGITDRPVVADPAITDFLQTNLWYSGLPDTTLILGRSEINLGNQRFVGAVAWRQHHQTFSGFRANIDAVPRTKLSYNFLARQHAVIGASAPMESHALWVDVDPGRAGDLTLYALILKYTRTSLMDLSTDTFGARWRGDIKVGSKWTIPYHVEYAKQNEGSNSSASVDAGYARAEIGGKCKWLWVTLGYELLEGRVGDGAFATPLATLHKFNGWADLFLATPADGLQDAYLGIGTKQGRWNALLRYHDFQADSTSDRYGSEIDGLVTWTAPWKQSFSFKFASYSADERAADVSKLWAYTGYKW